MSDPSYLRSSSYVPEGGIAGESEVRPAPAVDLSAELLLMRYVFRRLEPWHVMRRYYLALRVLAPDVFRTARRDGGRRPLERVLGRTMPCERDRMRMIFKGASWRDDPKLPSRARGEVFAALDAGLSAAPGVVVGGEVSLMDLREAGGLSRMAGKALLLKAAERSEAGASPVILKPGEFRECVARFYLLGVGIYKERLAGLDFSIYSALFGETKGTASARVGRLAAVVGDRLPGMRGDELRAALAEAQRGNSCRLGGKSAVGRMDPLNLES